MLEEAVAKQSELANKQMNEKVVFFKKVYQELQELQFNVQKLTFKIELKVSQDEFINAIEKSVNQKIFHF